MGILNTPFNNLYTSAPTYLQLVQFLMHYSQKVSDKTVNKSFFYDFFYHSYWFSDDQILIIELD